MSSYLVKSHKSSLPIVDKIQIAPSLLSADMANFEQEIQTIVGVADYIHCDVMDGHFVPNLTFGAPVIKAIKRVSPLPLDVHLMIDQPGRWISDYIKAGLDDKDFLTFHVEAERHPQDILRLIRDAGLRPGLSLKPGTPLEDAMDLLSDLDQLLIMTVEPGFGGQAFRSDMMAKVRAAAAALSAGKILAVDGGIAKDTIGEAARAGARLFTAGAAVYGQPDPAAAIRDLKEAARIALLVCELKADS
ncbi:MAG: ribulose-phosphate 3-epimerase [Calditrichota bacterium]